MFLEELSPLCKELFQNPFVFTGGFVSGALRLSYREEPLKNWLEKQTSFKSSVTVTVEENSNGDNPRQIMID